MWLRTWRLAAVLGFQPISEAALGGRIAGVGGTERVQGLLGGAAAVAIQLGLADAAQLAASNTVLAGTEDTPGLHGVARHAAHEVEVHAYSPLS